MHSASWVDFTTWMNHIGNERDMGSKMDIASHLPFYVHHNLGVELSSGSKG